MATIACSALPEATNSAKDQPSPASTEGGEWKIVPDDDRGTIVAQRAISGGLVSVKCESDGCRTLLITDGACEINSTIPILVNTYVESGVAQGECFPIADPSAPVWATSLIVLTEPNLLLPYMILGDDVSLAAPMSNGRIRVYLVSMDALRELIAPLRPDLFESPAWLNEHQLDPLPEDGAMDDDELILWRRGLLGI